MANLKYGGVSSGAGRHGPGYTSSLTSIPEPANNIDETVNGSRVQRRGDNVTVDFEPGARRTSRFNAEDFDANLAKSLPQTDLTLIADKVCEWVEVDRASRKDWDRRLKAGMQLLGLKNTPSEELPFDGASSVTHPVIAEACVQYQSRAIKEVFPGDGPCRTVVIGSKDKEREEQAQRVAEHMNYQMTAEDRAYFWETDAMLFCLPYAGSCFKKTYPDMTSGRIVSRLIRSANDFVVPYTATSLETAPRYTHIMRRNDTQMARLMANGFYRRVELKEGLGVGQAAQHAEELDEADDRTVSVDSEDNLWTLYECHVDLNIQQDHDLFFKGDTPFPLPYIVTVEADTQEVLSIRRNWKEGDARFHKRVWFTHYKYISGIGFYGFGLLHLMGSVAESMTGALRALLDSSAFANMKGGFISEEVTGLQGGDYTIDPGKLKRVKGTAEELSKGIWTPNWGEPSTALAQLFQHLESTARRFASTADEVVGDASNTGPVGTTLALIEQANVPISAQHQRLHRAQSEEFELRAELNFEFLPDEYPYEIEGEEKKVLRTDYDGRVDVIPMSDPNVPSNSHRIMQAGAIAERAESNPDIYDRHEVEQFYLEAIRVPSPERFLSRSAPKRMDPINENMAMLTGQPATAFVEQDHDAHIAVHMGFIQSIAENKQAMQTAGPALQAHLAEHYAFKYYTMMARELAAQGVEVPDPSQYTGENEVDPQMEGMLAQIAAQMPQFNLLPPDEGKQGTEDEDHAREQARKDEAHQREQARKDEAHQREEARKDDESQAEIARKAVQIGEKVKLDEQAAKAKRDSTGS